MNDLKKYAIIVAGGSGSRMGTEVPKQFLLLNGKPIINYALDVFLEAYFDIRVILVLPKDLVDTYELNDEYKDSVTVTAGGETRFESVKKGLAHVKEESIIFVHDSVRCLVTTSLIHRCYETAITKGSAIPCIPSQDSIRLMMDNGSFAYDRNKVMLVQTPQTFRSNILLPAFDQKFNATFTDEATVVEATGVRVEIVPGEENNIKITRPIDMQIAATYLLSHLK